MREPPSTRTSPQRGPKGLVQNGQGYEAGVSSWDRLHTHRNPVDSAVLTFTQNDIQERGNPPLALQIVLEQVVSRMPAEGRMGQEANAAGKADG